MDTRGVPSVRRVHGVRSFGRAVVRGTVRARVVREHHERDDAVRHEAIVRREESTRGAGEDAE